MLTMERNETVSTERKPVRAQSFGRALAGWTFVFLAACMAFGAAATAVDEGWRIFLFIDGVVLVLGLVVLMSMWILRRRRAVAQA
jgi:hypothetical protein